MYDFPLISIIVPVYNTQRHLGKCLDSILFQTYKKTEIILVDDGSTDGSAVLCDAYQRRHREIVVRHKDNGGLVSARKCGLEVASGEYICFVDSDDWIEPFMLEKLMQRNRDYLADIIAFGCVEDYGSFAKTQINSLRDGFYDASWMESHRRQLFLQNNFFSWSVLPHLCDKLIKRDLLKNWLCHVPDDISFGEDAANVFPCLQKAESLLVVNQPYYHYVQRKGSIVKSDKELPIANFQGLYTVLSKSFENDAFLMNQLKEYIFFTLMLKKYSSLDQSMPLFPFKKVRRKSRVFIYCAGGFGSVLKNFIEKSEELFFVGWSDSNYKRPEYQGENLIPPEDIHLHDFDMLIVTILNQKTAEEIVDSLSEMGIQSNKIDYVQKEVLDNAELPAWIYS